MVTSSMSLLSPSTMFLNSNKFGQTDFEAINLSNEFEAINLSNKFEAINLARLTLKVFLRAVNLPPTICARLLDCDKVNFKFFSEIKIYLYTWAQPTRF